MPLFDYACHDCGEQSEQLVSGSTEPKCPECGGTHLSKQLPIVAAPSRGLGDGPSRNPSAGSCGAGCGCHPHG
jgi:putative FmdB family regulatory protein